MDAHGDALAAVLADATLGNRQEFDGVADASGLLHVFLGDARDSLDRNVIDADARVEGQGRQDGALSRGVETLDVCGGVGLGETEVLRLLESLLVAQPLGAHRVQDEVSRAVDDAHDGRDAIAGEGLAQAVHDGDGARDGGLVVEVGSVGCGGLVQLGAVRGQEGLVAGDDRDAPVEGAQHEGARGSIPPISSTTRSMLSIASAGSVVSSSRSIGASRGASTLRTRTRRTSISAPERAAKSSRLD